MPPGFFFWFAVAAVLFFALKKYLPRSWFLDSEEVPPSQNPAFWAAVVLVFILIVAVIWTHLQK